MQKNMNMYNTQALEVELNIFNETHENFQCINYLVR